MELFPTSVPFNTRSVYTFLLPAEGEEVCIPCACVCQSLSVQKTMKAFRVSVTLTLLLDEIFSQMWHAGKFSTFSELEFFLNLEDLLGILREFWTPYTKKLGFVFLDMFHFQFYSDCTHESLLVTPSSSISRERELRFKFPGCFPFRHSIPTRELSGSHCTGSYEIDDFQGKEDHSTIIQYCYRDDSILLNQLLLNFQTSIWIWGCLLQETHIS